MGCCFLDLIFKCYSKQEKWCVKYALLSAYICVEIASSYDCLIKSRIYSFHFIILRKKKKQSRRLCSSSLFSFCIASFCLMKWSDKVLSIANDDRMWDGKPIIKLFLTYKMPSLLCIHSLSFDKVYISVCKQKERGKTQSCDSKE